MIERPNQPPGTLERKVELEQTVDYAIQVLVEEVALDAELKG